MAAPDLTGEFNATSIFQWLIQLFTGGPPTPTAPTAAAANTGASMYSGLQNFLSFLFGWGGPQSPQPAAQTSPATTSEVHGNAPPQKTFLGRMKDDFSAATDHVGQFFHGVAFDISKAVTKIESSCHSSPTGYCLASVEDAMTAGGLRFAGGKTIDQVMPTRNGSHWAKDLAPVLAKDGRFDQVSSGYGSNFNSDYTPKVGDIVVWTGGEYGHTQMFSGYDKDHKQVWISDFKSSPGNWTGLVDPNSHGSFQIFRQKPADDPTATAGVKPTTPRQGLTN